MDRSARAPAWEQDGPDAAEGASVASSRNGRWIRFGRALAEGEPVPTGAYVVGVQPWWEPGRWKETLQSAPGLRAQLRRAARKGVQVSVHGGESFHAGTRLRRELSELVSGWLRAHPLPPLGFAAEVAPFESLGQRRAFVARVEGEIVAALFVLPRPSRRAWFLDVLARSPASPNGTAELLLDAAFRAGATEGVERATLGLCPLSGPVPPELKWVGRLAAPLYDFEGLYAFRARLHPHAWERVLLEHPGQSRAAGTVRALRAFAGGSLLRYGLRALTHAAAQVK